MFHGIMKATSIKHSCGSHQGEWAFSLDEQVEKSARGEQKIQTAAKAHMVT